MQQCPYMLVAYKLKEIKNTRPVLTKFSVIALIDIRKVQRVA
jgi:hypothetical protein